MCFEQAQPGRDDQVSSRLNLHAPPPRNGRGRAVLSLAAAAALLALVLLLPGSEAADAQTAAPTVTDVEVSSTPALGNTYRLGETIRVTLTFSEAVSVSGEPHLKIDMDPAHWGLKSAVYESGSGGASLTFAHTVIEPNFSSQGIAVLANTLALNGGAIRSASSRADADLAHSGLGHDTGHKVNWRLSLPQPTVTFVAVSSVSGGDDTYGFGETLRVTLSFSESVTVTGTPQLAIDMDPANWGTKWAAYESGSGTSNLTFAHTVVEPNLSRPGIAVLANTLTLNGGTIRSASSQTDADLSHTGLDHDADHKVDWRLSPAEPNRAPVVNTGTQSHKWFASEQNAPRGVLVSKPFAGLFSDPDGDQLTYTVSISEGRAQLVENLAIGSWGRSDVLAAKSTFSREATMRVFLEADDDDDWDALEPPLPERPVITVTLTATDPAGLSASAQGDFLIIRKPGPGCELAPPEDVTAVGVERAAVAFWESPDDEDACESIGYSVSARSVAGGPWRTETTAPEARSHLLEDLTPGLVEYEVRVIYPEGKSKSPPTLQQTNVPAACNLTLTVWANVDRGISGRWDNVAGTPTGCVSGPEIEYEFKESTHDHFRNYGRFPNWPPANPDLPSFIAYDLKPGVTYDFRMIAVDAAGRKNASNVASATVVYDVSAVEDHSPTNLRVETDNSSGAFVTWNSPESFGDGRTLSTYVVEWKTGSAAASTENVAPAADGNHRHHLTGLTDGSVYTVRVAARTTGTAPATRDAWSSPAPPFTAWSEPLQLWFHNDAPVHITDRVFVYVEHNKPGEAECSLTVSGGSPTEINCPHGTPVNFQTTATTFSSLFAFRTLGEGTTDETTVRSSEHEGSAGGPSVRAAHASGGDGTLVVAWEPVTADYHVGTIDAYFVQHRKRNADNTWPSWPAGVQKAATDRTHTFTGLANGTWQVRVRARSANVEDHDDDDDTDDQTVHRLGFTSEIRTVTLAAGNTAVPGWPTHATVTPGVGSLIVQWEPPTGGGSLVHAYQVRHRPAYDYAEGGPAWTESPMIYPRQTQRICRARTCENPRRYEITGLTGGRNYGVEVRAHNANGAGEWIAIITPNIPNGFPPVVQSATVNGRTLALTFDRSVDTDSKPANSAFSVTAGGSDQTPTDVAISGSTVTLTLVTAVTSSQTVTVSYTKPDENPLQHNDAQAESFADQAVTNNTP